MRIFMFKSYASAMAAAVFGLAGTSLAQIPLAPPQVSEGAPTESAASASTQSGASSSAEFVKQDAAAADPATQDQTSRSGNIASVRELTAATNQAVSASREAALAAHGAADAAKQAVAASDQIAAMAKQAAAQAELAAKAAEAARVASVNNHTGQSSWTGRIITGLGAGFLIYGLIENANVTSNINGKRFSAAGDAAAARNTAYVIGTAGILVGVPIQIYSSRR